MNGYKLCPRCEARSIHLDTAMCDTCHLDRAIRGVLGLVDITPDQWPVEPAYGIAVRRAYHGSVPLIDDLVPPRREGLEQYQAEDR